LALAAPASLRDLRATAAHVMVTTTLATLSSIALAAPLAGQQQGDRPTLRAGRLEGVIRLDGRLDEPGWAAADSIGLTQVEPDEGGTATARTVVRVLAGPEAILIGVIAYDPDPAAIVSFSKAPDSDLENEDHIRLVLDTFQDGRTGYIFAVNPSGARLDALVANQGEGENRDWDAIWDAASRRTEVGWSVEIWLPIKSLIYGRGLRSWGFNLERRIARLQETDRWAGPQRDMRIGQTSRAGLLIDLPEFDLGLGLSVRPALTTGIEKPGPGAEIDETFHPSLDVTQRIGANLLASLTVNTDFAETEVDTRQTNLTRFPLFFPEKRTFFLEGTDIFDYGLGLETFRGPELLPFFSRRIGLVETEDGGVTVPLRLGAKLNGRAGGTNLGGLVARTGSEDGVAPAATLGVARVKRNIMGESSVGFVATAGDPLGRSGAWLVGPDFVYRTSRLGGSKNLLVGAWALLTGRDGLSGDRSAVGFKIDYPNDLWDVNLIYKRIGDGFDPSLGFVPRPAVHIADLNLSFQPRPGRLGLRQCFFELRPRYVADLSGEWESYRLFTAPLNCRFESGDRFEFNWAPEGERLDEPFEVFDGVRIQPGTYHVTRWRLEAEFAEKRPLSGQITWWFGGFFDGTRHQIILNAALKPSALLALEVEGERNIVRLPAGRFTTDLVGTRLNLNLSPDLQISSFVQYDNESRTFGSNTRVRWRFSPPGALFVVYNHNLLHPSDDSWRFDSSQLLIKAQYAFRY